MLKVFTVRLSQEQDDQLGKLASQAGRSKADLARDAISIFLSEDQNSTPEPVYLNGRMHEIIEFIFSCTYHQSQQQHGRDFIEQMLDEAIANRKKFHDR